MKSNFRNYFKSSSNEGNVLNAGDLTTCTLGENEIYTLISELLGTSKFQVLTLVFNKGLSLQGTSF